MTKAQKPNIQTTKGYKKKYGFNVPEKYVFKTEKGLNADVVKQISTMKNEPEWMLNFRLAALDFFEKKPLPMWGGDLTKIDFDNIYYYLKPTEKEEKSWDDVPQEMKNTFDRLGIPEAEKQHLAGVKAQFDSEVIYGSLLGELEEQGVIFMGTDEALQKHPEFFEAYFGKLIPAHDNKFAALNSAVWSGGSFVYIPKGVHVKRPLQAYFRINAMNMGQFERTLIIADEGSYAHYVEGCFTKGHVVTTATGQKLIEKIAVGDKVLTHTGKFKKVYKVQHRKYTGKLYSLLVWGMPTKTIEVTEEHPFLCARRRLKNDRNKVFTHEWVPAKDLSPKDYLVIPLDSRVQTATHKSIKVRYKNKVTIVNVRLTPDFFRLIGYYLAEGSLDNRGYLRFSFNSSEREYIDDVKRIITKTFNHKKFNEFTYKDRQGVELVISSAQIARFFKQFGTSSGTKSLPQWVLLQDIIKQKELIKGYFRGDGNYYNKQCKHGLKEIFRINTVSEVLAFQMRDLMLRCGVFACVNVRSREKENRQDMFTIAIGGDSMPVFGDIVGVEVATKINGHKRAGMFFVDGQYAYVPVKKITSRKVNAVPVYNFSVEGDESYVAESLAVHNCTAPVYSADSLHAAVVEVFVKPGARFRYTTIQNWSNDVHNLVTKRAKVETDGVMEWVDGNLGSRLTMKYPSCFLVGDRSHGEVLSIAYANKGMHQDAGAKMIHTGNNTSSTIISKSVSANGGRTSYRGLVHITPSAKNAKTRVECDALILDPESATDTFPTMKVDESSAQVEHEASVSKIGEEKLFYLMSRGLTQAEAMGLIVSGFIEPIVKELPLEYAVELNRLIDLEMEGSVG